MRKLFIFIFLFGCLTLTNATFAEEKKNEWIDPTYNFKQLKAIMVQYSISDDVKLDEAEKQKLIKKINDIFFTGNQKLKLKFISLQQAEDTIGEMTKINISELKVNDFTQYNDLMGKHLPNVVDAIVKLKITSQGYTTRHIPERTEYVTEHHYTYITHWHQNPHGFPYTTTERIDNPVTTLRIIPAYDMQVGHAGVEFEMLSNNNPKIVWQLTDIREAGGKQPINMTERICNRAIKKLAALVKGQKAIDPVLGE